MKPGTWQYFFSFNPGSTVAIMLHWRRTLVHQYFYSAFLSAIFLLIFFVASTQNNTRTSISLNSGWKTVANDSNQYAFDGFESPSFKDKSWKQVNVPHNWDAYEGYRRMRHGNRHGYAWYRKNFDIKMPKTGKRFFLFFEGVGSYGTVWLNNKKIGYHSGGRTTFTFDVTREIFTDGRQNTLAVRADHPAFIKDQPWVCGGCSEERGFSEGSQPMGIVRPVQLIITNELRIEPFGVHIWNDANVSERSAVLNTVSTIKNYSGTTKQITVRNRLIDAKGNTISEIKSNKDIVSGSSVKINQQTRIINNPILWSLENPYLYSMVTEVFENGKLADRLTTPYGIRWISWPVGKPASSNQFFLNGKPVFINGIAEYEHLIGNSHAFSDDQVRTRVMQIKTTGFNAFRDGHQPHNLRYQDYWDSLGILWWTQLSAHVWYDTPEFRSNFKTLLKEWVIERRNSPSVVLWGLQNESKLPAAFAKECTDLIRELDPTASSQRLVTTCNGGEGTDWDVPQNWTGTYGGNPATYADDIKRQILIGEYGAWRTIDLHTEGAFNQNGILSEDRMTQLMEMKVKLGELARDSSSGQFFWLLTSHDNPGRVQGGEGFRELDRIGPVNYKGLMTPWEEPLDVFYMFRSNYAPKDKEPMVYIASHTWPDRWIGPGKKDGIVVYSNCDEVELFNDISNASLGRKKRGAVGSHFQWDGVTINYNVLYAVGYVDGKPVAKDHIVLHHLPQAPNFEFLYKDATNITAPGKGSNYVYRVNCGGPEYTDVNGNTWLADRAFSSNLSPGQQIINPKSEIINQHWGSVSWTNNFTGMPAYFASQRRTYDPIAGTKDWPLFQDFRYGRSELKYSFPLPNGNYVVELFFIEPWLGTGGGMDCTGWRKFDVALNGKTVIKDLDIWKEAGHDKALRKSVPVKITGGILELSFPNVASGQAVISAIAIATAGRQVKPAPGAPLLIKKLEILDAGQSDKWKTSTWMNAGDKPYTNSTIGFASLPPVIHGAEWLQVPYSYGSTDESAIAKMSLSAASDVYIMLDSMITTRPIWLADFEYTNTMMITNENGGRKFGVYRKRFAEGNTVVLGANGSSKSGNPAAMYSVAVVAANTMEPAYDLKPVIGYRPPEARLLGVGLVKETVNERESILFKKATGDTIEWQVAIGAADIYSITLRYANTTGKTLKAKLELLAADGTLMKTSTETFVASNPGKWNYINSSSGTMINAGNYRIRIHSVDAAGLSISGLDVQ